MHSYARLSAVLVLPLALVAGCTFASPTTSTYNAGKVADAGTSEDGGAAATGTTSPSSTGASGTSSTSSDTSATGGATCCAESGGAPEGTCIPTSAVPPASASYVEADTCSTGNVCVPTSQVNGTPTKCGLVGGLLGGVCMGTCFSSYLSLASAVLTSTECATTDVCVPCEALQGRGVAGCDE